jgi:hypothetical protein
MAALHGFSLGELHAGQPGGLLDAQPASQTQFADSSIGNEIKK